MPTSPTLAGAVLRSTALLAIILAGALPSQAASVTLNASDALGTTSFDSNLHWSNSAAPSSGNDYSTGDFQLRTPTTNNYTGTFGGNSLTLNNTNGTAGGILFKSTGTSNTTINNLIIDGGAIRDGNGNTDTVNLLGSINITSNGGVLTQQAKWNIQSSISGAGNLTMASGGLQLTFSGANTSTGNLIFTAANSIFTLANTGAMTFAIGANHVNNAVTTSGAGAGTATFNGTFNFNLTGADATTVGNSWTIVGAGLTKSFGGTFAVNGFTEVSNVWTSANGVYQFSEATGVLSVISAIPEPSTYATILGGLTLAGAALKRRRSSLA